MHSDKTSYDRHKNCYLLHARPYRETSLLVRIFHRENGVLSAVAKGAASHRKLQPFYPFSARITGRGDLKTLVAAEEDGTPWILSPQASLAALYANELVLASCAEQDAHPGLFDAYVYLLTQLAKAKDVVAGQASLRRFEGVLFSEIGYEINYQVDASDCPIRPDGYYNLGSDWVFVVDSQGRYTGAQLLAIAKEDYSDTATQQAARRLTRDLLQRILGKSLNSWKLFGNPTNINRQ